jgi:hypothetical protein
MANVAPKVNGCTGKRKFATAELALQVNATMRRRNPHLKKMHAYKCEHCGCWHASHFSPEENAAMLARVEGWKRTAWRGKW